ncbi:MAG: hypothetical protein E6J11_11800 [Chloroflexi bacterium]|nr:MAG: hypothetical protein E6J36_02450 [Chloroflexota bacterium]TMC96583.1 MAG: hypothetical protein E6J11_11800 [Chloroflexota bacterium]
MPKVFIELPLLIVHTVGIHVCILADVERSDNAIIGSCLTVHGQALPDHKHLLSEALDIVAVCYHRDPSDATLQGGFGGSCLLMRCLFTSCAPMSTDYPGWCRSREKGLAATCCVLPPRRMFVGPGSERSV